MVQSSVDTITLRGYIGMLDPGDYHFLRLVVDGVLTKKINMSYKFNPVRQPGDPAYRHRGGIRRTSRSRIAGFISSYLAINKDSTICHL